MTTQASRQGKIGVQVWLDRETHKAFRKLCIDAEIDMSTAIRNLIKIALLKGIDE